MSKNSNLNNARKNKNDEFYTLIEDIDDELSHYTQSLAGKSIYCNCDNPYKSNFVKWFITNFNRLNLKELYATCYCEEKPKHLFMFSEDEFNDTSINDKAYKLHITKVDDNMPYDIDAIASLDGNYLETLRGDGSFRSNECVRLLENCDIVVTNPPFSLFRKFMDVVFKSRKQYIILGNNNAFTYDNVFNRLKNGKLWAGYNCNASTEFHLSDDYDTYTRIEDDGSKYGEVQITWFTNVEHDYHREPLELTVKYDEKLHRKYDNYDAINVDRSKDVPMDYYGLMGVPISFISKWCPEQFEIVGMDKSMPDNPNYGKRFMLDGRETYARIIIRRKTDIVNL